MLLRQLCKKCLAVLPPPTPPPPPLLLLLLLCCCCCYIRVPVTFGYLFSVFLKKYAVLRDASRSFFSIPGTRFVFLVIGTLFRRFAHRKRKVNYWLNDFTVKVNYWLNDFYRKHSNLCTKKSPYEFIRTCTRGDTRTRRS